MLSFFLKKEEDLQMIQKLVVLVTFDYTVMYIKCTCEAETSKQRNNVEKSI